MKLSLAAVLAFAAPAFAGEPVPNRPYVQSGPDGVFYARCVPDGDTGSAGTTKVFKVGHEKDELIDVYAWYAAEGVTLGWSPIAGKVAVLARRNGSELSFHLGGKPLTSFTTEDLGKLGVEVTQERGPTGPVPRAVYRVAGCVQVPGTNEYDFVIEAGKVRLAFDILTGKTRAKADQKGGVSLPTATGFRELKGKEAEAYTTTNAWLAERLKDANSIKVGSTYADVAEHFKTDGGVSQVGKHRLVMILCPYIKIDVEFEAVKGETLPPAAKVAKVSRPYFEPEYAD